MKNIVSRLLTLVYAFVYNLQPQGVLWRLWMLLIARLFRLVGRGGQWMRASQKVISCLSCCQCLKSHTNSKLT